MSGGSARKARGPTDVATAEDLTRLLSVATIEERRVIQDMLTGLERMRACPFHTYYPDTGPLRRELYWWAVAFWAAGTKHKERGLMAANQVGKTLAVGYEVTAHLTGRYPRWWEGARFAHVNRWWLAGDTQLTTRDILQTVMLGPIDGLDAADWRGMIPPDTIRKHTRKSGGVPKCVDTVWVQHVTGKLSSMQFRSYDQGRRAFQGVPLSGGVWLDEEPPDPEVPQTEDGSGAAGDIYSECLTRLAATDGLMLWSYTPLRGMTPFTQAYLESAVTTTRDGRTLPAREAYFPEEESEE